MKFIGVVSEDKYIKSKLIEHLNNKKNIYNIVNINEKNINSLKDLNFETIVINDDIEKNIETLNKILVNSKYVIVNSNNKLIQNNQKHNIITYGLNFNADVTVSSIKEDKIMVCMQKDIENIYNKIEEPHEFNVRFKDRLDENKLEDNLAIAAVMEIYNKKVDKF